MRTQSVFLFGIFGALILSLGLAAGAQERPTAAEALPQPVEVSPHQVVEDVTTELMKVVHEGKASLQENPQKYFGDVRSIMEEAVDFKYIARNVMGAKYWKAASREQKQRFVEVFTSGLVETYAKGMANFADYEISVQKPDVDVADKKKVEVIQRFRGPDGVNRVSYTMGKHRSGDWKLINVVLDGVNLGKTLRAQFSQSVADSQGDLDAAIDGWTWQS